MPWLQHPLGAAHPGRDTMSPRAVALAVPPWESTAAVTPWLWGQGTYRGLRSLSLLHGVALRREEPVPGAGSPLLPMLPALPVLSADQALLPQKVRVVKIEQGHGMAGRWEAPDPPGRPRGQGREQG